MQGWTDVHNSDSGPSRRPRILHQIVMAMTRKVALATDSGFSGSRRFEQRIPIDDGGKLYACLADVEPDGYKICEEEEGRYEWDGGWMGPIRGGSMRRYRDLCWIH